ncbi:MULTISPECIES: hypothetical protein [unclassified Methylobacterium]|uniref:hypothetical protein n=1 Tax=unclassified Methylobacterium TaxID=2615210 RepID=UPI001FBB03F4|nr:MULTISPECIES: hypothetical protein [unclassified Methylobacterium]MCJ2091079.1 hypothetical protein [Methylobacterium sp. J-072]MCJ2142402.1 hypothetical protein [Methylobacterium sp. E-066]
MSFTVTARESARRFAYQHASLLNALDHGMSLIAAGMADVFIADGNGLTRTPADLYRHLFGGSSAESARVLEGQTEGLALAA